jgi:hypothetical protein
MLSRAAAANLPSAGSFGCWDSSTPRGKCEPAD